MSYADGWAAVNLEMPQRVPRIEFDAQVHWPLVRQVTGIDVYHDSDADLKTKASRAFIKAWNYDLIPGSMLHVDELEACHTQMGHAVYVEGGDDFVPDLHEAFTDPYEALKFDPWEVFGEKDHDELVRRFEKHYCRQCEVHPDLVNTTGTYITLLTGAIYIFGWEMLLTMAGLDADGFGEVLNRYRSWMQQYYDALAETSAPLIASHDDIVWREGAIFKPDWYRTYIFPNLTKLYEPLLAAGKKVLFISDGDYTAFIDDIADCGAHGFFMEPLTDMAYVAEKYGRTHFFIGNADTHVLLRGNKAEIRAEVQRCMAIGKDCPGWFMGVTNMSPANTPVESALYYNECYEEMAAR
jgi:uroporphyrinogen-III decarboxylase